MQPDRKKSDDELLAWAASIAQQKQRERIYGTVTIHFEAGRITRVRTETNEVPPVTNATDK